MKTLLWIITIIGFVYAVIGNFAAVIYFIYEPAANDAELKIALWEACKLWIIMGLGGNIVGGVSYFFAETA